MPIQTSPQNEIAAIRRMCKAQWTLHTSETLTTSPEHYGIVTGFFNKALELKESTKDPLQKIQNRQRRCRVVQLFIGRPVESFKRLTHHECQILVDQLKLKDSETLKLSGDGMKLIQWADAYLEDNPSVLFEEELEETADDNQPQPQPVPAALPVEEARNPFAGTPWPDLQDLW